MKQSLSFIVLSLVGLALGAPTSSDKDGPLVLTKDIFPKDSVIYSGMHKIVNLLLPLNNINLQRTGDSTEYNANSIESGLDVIIFFVEADIDTNGNRVDRGLYVRRDRKVKKILEHGRDAAASKDNSTLAFFGADDGIYAYDYDNNSAYKYGSVDDSIICIGKELTGDVIYILTEDQKMFKVSKGGMKKERLHDVVDAKQFVLDLSDNIYFYTDDMQVYVRTDDVVKKIEGLPRKPSYINLIRPIMYLFLEAVPVVVDDGLYFIFSNGTSYFSEFIFERDAKPSAFAPDAFFLQYHAHTKKIYEFNLIEKIFNNDKSALDDSIDVNVDKILAAANAPKRLRQRQPVFFYL